MATDARSCRADDLSRTQANLTGGRRNDKGVTAAMKQGGRAAVDQDTQGRDPPEVPLEGAGLQNRRVASTAIAPPPRSSSTAFVRDDRMGPPAPAVSRGQCRRALSERCRTTGYQQPEDVADMPRKAQRTD